jgi:hypothetical protein
MNTTPLSHRAIRRTVMVLPGETIPAAIARHRRDTGHRGASILMLPPVRHAA